ncbi:hypothetical protein HWV62_41174 [Athelia sp. TMB]|nr:hypothetical protein HWV62_41174 [Athelia sp. TMB]
MPEGFCLKHGAEDIESQAGANGETSGLPASDPQEHGHIFFHKAMLAKEKGARPSISLHHCAPDDAIFSQLPPARSANGKTRKKGGMDEGPCTVCAMVEYADYGDEAPSEPLSDDDPNPIPQQDELESQTLELGPGVEWSKLRNKTACDIANGLRMSGQLFVAQRGKEYVICVGQFLIRINLAMEAHAFWFKTVDYDEIVSSPMQKRGKKTLCWPIPSRLFKGPPGATGCITIQMAFRRPDWTLVFADHNSMITFHIMHVKRCCVESDFKPCSQMWRHIWSHTHGPDPTQEPKAFNSVLQKWRESMCSSTQRTPIVVEVRNNQRVFNGYGAQESADMLFLALIHPVMPAHYICMDDKLFKRFSEAVVQYRQDRKALVSHPRLPLLSSALPFVFRESAHKFFLQKVSCFSRHRVAVTQQTLDILHDMGILDPDAQINPDGTAMVNLESPSLCIIKPRPLPVPIRTRTISIEAKTHNTRSLKASSIPTQINPPHTKADAKVYLPNYKLSIYRTETGDQTMSIYTPFTAQSGADWWPIISAVAVPQADDVSQEVNKTTIGPYSFHVFVAAAWTLKHIGDSAPRGRRPLLKLNGSYTKRAKVEDLKRGVGRPSKRKRLNNEDE